MRAPRFLVAVTAVITAGASLPFLVPAAPAQETRITICHANSAANNAYTSNSLPLSAVDGGNDNGDHFNEHTGPLATSQAHAEQLKADKIDWGDIIPPIDGVHNGLNWPDGQAILEAGCNFASPTGSLRVSKDVDGDPAAGTTFTIAVDCDGGDFDTSFTFDETGALDPAGQDNPITDIPAGTDCDVTETGDGGADATTYDPGGTTPPTVTITGGQQTTVTVTNTFIDIPPGTGALLVTKGVEGEASSGTTFTVDVDCSDNAFDTELTFDENGDLDPASQVNPITGLPLNTTCTVDETDDGGADSVAYTPGGTNAPTVTITTAGVTVNVVVTNTFERKVDICHRTDSVVNPYNLQNLPASAVDGGNDNGDHFNEHTGPIATSQAVAQQLKDAHIEWGDIIPPVGSHEGLNWPEGEAMLENGCNFVTPGTGSLRVTKVVDGNGTPPVGTTFTIEVDCDDNDFDTTLTFDETGTLDPANQDDPITDIPAGTECTVTETGDGGADAVTYNPGATDPPTVTIESGQQASVTVTNTFVELPPGTGALLVTKAIEGSPDSGTTFAVGVDCSDDNFDRTLAFDDAGALISGNSPITGLPLNTTCTVTETDDGGADSVSYDPGGANPPTVTITTAGDIVSVVVTNTFERQIAICHRTDSVVNPYNLQNLPESAVDGVGNGDHFLEHVGPIATSEEVAQQLKDAHIEWGDIIPPVGSHEGLNWPEGEAMLENGCNFVTVLEGSLLVTKELAGNGSPAPGTTFTVAVDCDGNAFDTSFTFDEAGALDPASQTNPIPGIPAGTECTVTETGTGGADAVTYNPGGTGPPTITIESGTPSTVTVTNTFVEVPPGTGALLVSKVVDGSPDSGAVFTIAVDCSDDAFDTTLTFDETGALGPPNQDDPILGLPLNTTCTVTETIDGGADSVTYDPGGADPPTVTITTSGAVVTVVVTNRFDPAPPPPPDDPDDGELTVRKIVEGEPPGDARFVVLVDCDTLASPVELVFTEDSRGPKSIDDIPLPTECDVVETRDGGASEVSYSPEDGEVTLTEERPERSVTVTNEFDDEDREEPDEEEPPVRPDEPDRPVRPPGNVEPPTPGRFTPPVQEGTPVVTITNPVVQQTLAHTGSGWTARLLNTGALVLLLGLCFVMFGHRRAVAAAVPAAAAAVPAAPRPPVATRHAQASESATFQEAVADFLEAFERLQKPLRRGTDRR